MDLSDEYTATGYRIVASPEKATVVSDWAFFSDPIGAARRNPSDRFAVLVRVPSGRVDTLEQRIADFAKEVNARRPMSRKRREPRVAVPKAYMLPRKEVTDQLQEHPGDRLFPIVADRALYELMLEYRETSAPDHPGHDVFLLHHGLTLPADAIGEETSRAPAIPPAGPPDAGVVVTAVIDVGLPFLNHAFRDAANRTRVKYAWVQDGKSRNAQSFVPYGREFDEAQINELIERYPESLSQQPELAAYRDEGLADHTRKGGQPLGYRSSHGASVASLAGGYPPRDNRVDNPLIFVQLPQAAAAETSGASLEPYFVAALDYVTERADRIAMERGCGQLPLVINFSFGGTGGPLDGTSPIEQKMDAVLKARNSGQHKGKTAIVLPAGNSYLSQCHARLHKDESFPDAGSTATLRWRIQPDDQTSSFVEIWTPVCSAAASLIEVGFTPPGSAPASPFLGQAGGMSIEWSPRGDVVAKLGYEFVPAPTNRGKFTLAVQATAAPGTGKDVAPAGLWSIVLRNKGLQPGQHVDAWILRDDELPGLDNDARQSRFVDPAYRRYDQNGFLILTDQPGSAVVRAGLQNVLATGHETIVVGGYVDESGKLSDDTAGGPTNVPDRPGPDAVAVSDDSIVHWGLLGSAVLSGGQVAMNGTSVSVPLVVRRLVAELAAGRKVDRTTVRKLAEGSESADFDGRAPKPGEERGGHGRIQTRPQTSRRYYPRSGD